MNTIIKQTVFKRKGDNGVFAELSALAHTHPDMTVGELAKAVEKLTVDECRLALKEKGE